MSNLVSRVVRAVLGKDSQSDGVVKGREIQSPFSSTRLALLRTTLLPIVSTMVGVSRVATWLGFDKDMFGEIFARGSVIAFGLPRPKFRTIEEMADRLPANPSPTATRKVLTVLVVDNFYPDPEAVRRLALDVPYVEYHRGWWVTGLENRENPLKGTHGFRHNGAEIRDRLRALLGANVREDSWELAGDGWNGAFHLRFAERLPRSDGGIHNHLGSGASPPAGEDSAKSTSYETERGWSGIVYLNPNPPKGSGTSIWMLKSTGQCFSSQEKYWPQMQECELAYYSENVFNRLLLIESRVLHRAEAGFGTTTDDARLTQTFFFDVD